MEEIQIFRNEEFGEIRVTEVNGEPWFVAADVCKALEIKNSRDALSRLDEDEKGVALIDTRGGTQKLSTVNEPGLYAFVLGSRKPEAKQFKRWITHEVIPSIRKNGGYIAGQETMTDEELLERAVLVAQKKIAERDKIIQEQKEEINVKDQVIGELKPKADYTDMILRNPSLVTITQIAKDYGMSAREMNKALHEAKIQFKQSGQWLLYRKYHGLGYTHSETVKITRADGHGDVVMHTKWTQKGRLFIYHELKGVGILPMIEKEENDEEVA